MLHCPNCGLENPDNAKFCSNCGTPFVGAPAASSGPGREQPQYAPPPYTQSSGPYQPAPAPATGNSIAKNIGLGCLIAIAIMLLVGLSCTRACFGHRHRVYVQHRY